MRWLTPDGVVAALVVGGAVTWGLSWRGLAVLTLFFITGSLLSQLAERRGPRRSARQVLANGGVAALAALVGSWSAAAGALAAATADTWATEIGAFSPVPPRLLTTGRAVPRGASGGVTLLGTLGGIAGAGIIAAVATALAPRGGARAPGAVIALAGVGGMLADSLLGATLQGKYACPACDARFERGSIVCHEPVRLSGGQRWLDNDLVNLAATVSGAAVAVLGSHLVAR